MRCIAEPFEGLKILESDFYADFRGEFFESFNENEFNDVIGGDFRFVQDNHSASVGNVLRGLHFQRLHPQGKLIRVVNGEIFDVVVDLRRSSTTFLQWFGIRLTAESKRQIWVPPGCAHGFLASPEGALVLYKATEYWHPEDEYTLRFDDPTIAIQWPLPPSPILLSKKDQAGLTIQALDEIL